MDHFNGVRPNIVSRQTRKGDTVVYGYDTLNRLITKAVPSDPAVTYGYDLVGRLVSASDNSSPMTAVSPVGGTQQFVEETVFDSLNRPVSVSWSPVPSQTPPSAESVTFDHTYDATNRRIKQAATDDSWWNYPGSGANISYTTNVLNQYSAVGLVNFDYDANGNLSCDGDFHYSYDSESRLKSIDQLSGLGNCASSTSNISDYAYDAQGRRKLKAVGAAVTAFVTGADGREILEYDGNTGAVTRWFGFGAGRDEAVSQVNLVGGNRTTLIPDIQGSVVGELDSSSGGLVKTGYQIYGEHPGLTGGAFHYTGRRLDAETSGSLGEPSGIYFYRARMYSPTLGRFLQADLIGYKDGMNLYAYVSNDPLNKLDPSGLAAVITGMWSVAAAFDNPLGGGGLCQPLACVHTEIQIYNFNQLVAAIDGGPDMTPKGTLGSLIMMPDTSTPVQPVIMPLNLSPPAGVSMYDFTQNIMTAANYYANNPQPNPKYSVPSVSVSVSIAAPSTSGVFTDTMNNGGVNSNSIAAGLLNSVGGASNVSDIQSYLASQKVAAPGLENPVPPSYFGLPSVPAP